AIAGPSCRRCDGAPDGAGGHGRGSVAACSGGVGCSGGGGGGDAVRPGQRAAGAHRPRRYGEGDGGDGRGGGVRGFGGRRRPGVPFALPRRLALVVADGGGTLRAAVAGREPAG